jgi:hypothetical protein
MTQHFYLPGDAGLASLVLNQDDQETSRNEKVFYGSDGTVLFLFAR